MSELSAAKLGHFQAAQPAGSSCSPLLHSASLGSVSCGAAKLAEAVAGERVLLDKATNRVTTREIITGHVSRVTINAPLLKPDSFFTQLREMNARTYSNTLQGGSNNTFLFRAGKSSRVY